MPDAPVGENRSTHRGKNVTTWGMPTSLETGFVGRVRDLERISQGLRRIDGAGVLISGPSGSGKSRLAAEAATAWAQQGRVHRVTGSRAIRDLPYGAVAALLPTEFDPLAPLDDFDRLRLVRAVARALSTPAVAAASVVADPMEQPVLLIDDSHLLDRSSAELIGALLAMRQCRGIVVGPSMGSLPDPFSALSVEGSLDRIDLAPLSPDEIDEFVGTILVGTRAGPVDGTVMQALIEFGGGRPLYLNHLITHGIGVASLVRQGELWTLAAPLTASTELRAVVESQLAPVTEVEREVLHLLAVWQPLRYDDVVALLTASSVDPLLRCGLVVERAEGGHLWLSIAVGLHREVVRQGLGGLRERALSAMIADRLAGRPSKTPDEEATITTLRFLAGMAVARPDQLRATRWLLQRGDLETAGVVAEAAWRAQPDADAAMALGAVFAAQGEFARADAIYGAAESSYGPGHTPVGLRLAQANNGFWGLGQIGPALASLEAVEHENLSMEELNRVRIERLSLLTYGGRLPEAAALAESLPDDLDPRTSAALAVAWGPGLAILGRADEALTLVRRGRGHPSKLGAMLDATEAFAVLQSGDLVETKRLAGAAYDRAVRNASTPMRLWMARVLGHVDTEFGQLRQAYRWLVEANSAGVGHTGMAAVAMAGRVIVLAQRGMATEAAALMAAIDDGPSSPFLTDVELCRAGAWTAAAGGDLLQAKKLGLKGAAQARVNGDAIMEASALHDVVRFGSPGEVAARLVDLAAGTASQPILAFANHAQALVANDPGAIGSAARGFSALAFHARAAEAAADVATCHRRLGDERAATLASGAAWALLRRTDGLVTPPLRSLAPVVELSAREREIAEMAARGATSPEIASELSVSARTVESHIANAMAKLGARTRADLGVLLDPGTPPAASSGRRDGAGVRGHGTRRNTVWDEG